VPDIRGIAVPLDVNSPFTVNNENINCYYLMNYWISDVASEMKNMILTIWSSQHALYQHIWLEDAQAENLC
jgi:hypothetical protein